MSTWREFRRSVRKVASKAVSKTGDLTDTASLRVKLARKEALLADIYEQFGRVAYQKIKTGADVDRKIKILIEKIDVIRAEIYDINRLINEKKIAREEEENEARETEAAITKVEIENGNIQE